MRQKRVQRHLIFRIRFCLSLQGWLDSCPVSCNVINPATLFSVDGIFLLLLNLLKFIFFSPVIFISYLVTLAFLFQPLQNPTLFSARHCYSSSRQARWSILIAVCSLWIFHLNCPLNKHNPKILAIPFRN